MITVEHPCPQEHPYQLSDAPFEVLLAWWADCDEFSDDWWQVGRAAGAGPYLDGIASGIAVGRALRRAFPDPVHSLQPKPSRWARLRRLIGVKP